MPKVEFNNRLEVGFDSVPPMRDRAALQALGFTFDGRPTKKVWFLRREPNTVVNARGGIEFVDGWQRVLAFLVERRWLNLNQADVLTQAREEAHHRAGVEGMLEANGII